MTEAHQEQTGGTTPESKPADVAKFVPQWATSNGPLDPAVRGANGFSANNLSENIGRKYKHTGRDKIYQVMDIVWNDSTDEWNFVIAECLFRDRPHGIKIVISLTALTNKFTSVSHY